MDLFNSLENQNRQTPLAELLRPRTLEEYLGQNQVIGKNTAFLNLLNSGRLFSCIFWGPPGCGKTTLARLIATKTSSDFIELSAVNSSIKDIKDCVDQAKRELTSRFDLKNSNSDINLEADKCITITTNDDMKLRNILDILQTKLVKRNINIKVLDPQPVENALGGNVRQVFNLKKGLSTELAKKIVADIKNSKLKVQASIQGEQVRVSGKSKDDLQEVIRLLKGKEDDYDIPLQFQNYR